MKYAIARIDGGEIYMTTRDDVDPAGEIEAWPQEYRRLVHAVPIIRAIDEWPQEEPIAEPAAIAAASNAQPEIKEAVIALAETISFDRQANEARIAKVEAFIAELTKGV